MALDALSQWVQEAGNLLQDGAGWGRMEREDILVDWGIPFLWC